MARKPDQPMQVDCDNERPWREGLPVRSCLLSLAPMGVGTEQCESLSSYVARLALAHRVSIRDLATEIIWPAAVGGMAHVASGCRPWRVRTLAGTGECAAQWSSALSELTKVPGLEALTLVRWGSVLPTKGQIADEDRWCPACWTEDRAAGRTVYGRLLWELHPATACPTHGTQLATVCPSCGAKRERGDKVVVPVVGYCHRCDCWLGDQESPQASADQVRRAQQLGALVRRTADLAERPDPVALGAVLREGVRLSFDGNVAAFAKSIGRSKTAPQEWMLGNILASLPTLVDAALVLNVSLPDLMAGTAVVERVGHPQSVDIDERKKRKPARQIDWAALEKEFGELALQEPPLSLTDIAARIGLDLRQVGKRWPDLAKQVSARYRALSDETWRNRMEQRFAAADRAAQLLMEAGLPATPKNMKEVLADEFCFAGSRLWTTWRERHLSGAPLVEPTT